MHQPLRPLFAGKDAKKIDLEKITLNEFNAACEQHGLNPDKKPFVRNTRNLVHTHRDRPIVYARVFTIRDGPEYLRLRFSDLREIVGYFEAIGAQVECIHPFGYWGISNSAQRTREEGQQYFDEIVGLKIETLMLRIRQKSNKIEKVDDSLLFKYEAGKWTLRKLKILYPNLGLYDLGRIGDYVRLRGLPIIHAVYPK